MRWINLLFALFISCFIQNNSIEAQDVLNQLNGPWGGGARVYEGKAGVLFQFIYQYSKPVIFKSNDGGLFWSKVLTLPAPILSNPYSVGLDGNLFNFDPSRIYKSINNGQSWTTTKAPVADIKVVNSLPNGTILLSSGSKIFQSIDSGATWKSSIVSNIQNFFYNSAKNEIYAINQNELYLSKNNGVNWQLVYTDDFGYKEKNIIFAANGIVLVSGVEFIWKFDENGNFIHKVDPKLSTGRQIDIAFGRNNRLIAFEYSDLFYSDDLGETWTLLASDGSEKNVYKSLSSTSSGVLFGVKLNFGLFRSEDNALTWSFSAMGIPLATVNEIDFISETKILALTNDGLFYTKDDGQNWSFLSESHDHNLAGEEMFHVLVNNEEIYYFNFDKLIYFKDPTAMPVSIDIFGQGLSNLKNYINPKTESLFSLNLDGIFRSTNKGYSWVKYPISNPQCMYFFSDGTILVATLSGIFRSVDDGLSWSLVLDQPMERVIKLIGNYFMEAYAFFYKNSKKFIATTIDNGITWEEYPLDTSGNTFEIKPGNGLTSNNLGQVFSYENCCSIIRSVDQGRNFKSFALYTFGDYRGLDISPNQRVYIRALDDGIWRSKSSTSSSKVLRGHVFLDENKNCYLDSIENGIAGQKILADNGTKKVYGNSNKKGDFSIPIESGTYNIAVSTPNNYWNCCNKTYASSMFSFNDSINIGLQEVIACPFMQVDIQPSRLVRCFNSELFINYINSGTEAAKNSNIEVKLDSFFDFISSTKPVASQTGNVFLFDLGDLPRGSSGSFKIVVKVSCNSRLGQFLCAEAHIYPDTSCTQALSAHIRTSANCLGDTTQLTIRNIGFAPMKSSKKWSIIDQVNSLNSIHVIETGSYFLNTGQEFKKLIASSPNILFTAEQDDGYPYDRLSTTEVISCTQNPIPGSTEFKISTLDQEEPFISKFCERNRGSFDPNEITGYPDGITSQRYIDNSQELEYVIRFQNTGTDTAFNIRIENQIPTTVLDLATLTLGASSHPYQFILDPDGKLIFSFSNILLPDSSINESTSHGFVQYSIKPIKQLSNGTKILNDALIYFDYNNGVNTNVDLHTIGSPIPVKVSNVGQSSEIDFQIVPNPMQEFSSVFINAKSKNEHYKLSCLDVYSKLMWEMDVTGNSAYISKGELIPGVYLLVLKNKKGVTLASNKMVIE